MMKKVVIYSNRFDHNSFFASDSPAIFEEGKTCDKIQLWDGAPFPCVEVVLRKEKITFYGVPFALYDVTPEENDLPY